MFWCIFSSSSFITNSIGAYLYGEYTYSFLWGMLCTSSLWLHSIRIYTNNDANTVSLTELYQHPEFSKCILYTSFLFDQIVLYLVVFTGACLIYKKWATITFTITECICLFFIAITFILTIWLYYSGHSYTNIEDANKYHSMIHYIGSFGHHCILLL